MFSRLYQQKAKGEGPRNTTCISDHLNQISQFLIDDLAHHDFKHAAIVLATLVHHAEKLVEVIWKCGVEVLENRPSTRREVLPYLKSLFLRLVEHREELFLEILLLLVDDGSLGEAYSFCMNNIHQKPFKDNPVLRGYFGMLAYLLWLEDYQDAADDGAMEDSFYPETTFASSFAASGFQSSLGFDLNLTTGRNSMNSSQMSTAASAVKRPCGQTPAQLRDTAIKYFQSLADIPGSWDSFILAFVNLIDLARPEALEVRHVLESYKETNLQSTNANYFLCRHMLGLHERLGCSKEEVRFTFLSLIDLCPANDLILQFLPFAESPAEATSTIMQFLDFPQCAACVCGWQQLEECLVSLGGGIGDLAAWTEDRCYWWPQCYFDSPSTSAADEEMLLVRRQCQRYLLPDVS